MIKIFLILLMFFDVYLPIIFSPPPPISKIAVLGDSISLGAWDYKPDGVTLYGYRGRVADYFHADHEYFPRYNFVDIPPGWAEVVAYNPDTIILQTGTHAVADLPENSDVNLHAAIGDSIDRALLITPRVVYVEISIVLGSDEFNARAPEINAIIRDEAAARGIKTVNVLDKIIACGDACKTQDIHPNGIGHQIIADGVIAALQ